MANENSTWNGPTLKLLLISGCLATGEAVAAQALGMIALWPVVALTLIFTCLIGYGIGVTGWHYIAILLLGILLLFHDAHEQERRFRDSPWLRGRSRQALRASPSCTWQRTARHNLARRVGIGLAHCPEIARLNRAILLGERQHLAPNTRLAFITAGTMHIFAISGLHVMILSQTLVVILSLLFIPRRWAGFISLLPLWLYVWIIGLPPSAVRAAIMASFYHTAPLVWRRNDLLRSWALTFLLVHLVHPMQIADIGNLLSFSVMLGIALALKAPFMPHTTLGATLWISMAAWLAGLPIAAHVFGRITPGGLLANLILIPAAELTVSAGVLGIVISAVSTTLASHLNNLAALFTGVMVEVSRTVAALPLSCIDVPHWPIPACLGFYALLGLLAALACWFYRRRKAVIAR